LAQGIAPAEPLFDHLIGAQQERRRHIDIDCSDAKRPPRLLTRTDTSRLMLWFFLLVLVLGLVLAVHAVQAGESSLLFQRERNTLPELGLKEWMAPVRASPRP
jgi:hypothetical protein